MTKDEALKLALEALKTFHYAMIDAGVLDRQEVLNQGFTAATAIKEALAQPERDYERGFIDGMQKQMQSSVDKAVNRMAQPQRTWVGLTEEEKHQLNDALNLQRRFPIIDVIEAKLREKNGG